MNWDSFLALGKPEAAPTLTGAMGVWLTARSSTSPMSVSGVKVSPAEEGIGVVLLLAASPEQHVPRMRADHLPLFFAGIQSGVTQEQRAKQRY